MNDEQLFELAKILNDSIIDWKIRRALIRHGNFELSEEQIKDLVPEEE